MGLLKAVKHVRLSICVICVVCLGLSFAFPSGFQFSAVVRGADWLATRLLASEATFAAVSLAGNTHLEDENGRLGW